MSVAALAYDYELDQASFASDGAFKSYYDSIEKYIFAKKSKSKISNDFQQNDTLVGGDAANLSIFQSDTVMPVSIFSDRPLGSRLRGRNSDVAKIEEELISYLELSENWDGYNGRAPSVIAVNEACQFIRLLEDSLSLPIPQVSGDGSVGFYWESDNSLVDIEFRGCSEIVYFARHNNKRWKGDKPFRGRDIPSDLLQAIEIIART